MLGGLLAVLNLQNLLVIFGSSVAGLAIGALPGLTAAMGVALLVPLTFGLSPVAGLSALCGLYMAAVYGGCFSAILINTPGTPSSIATAFDGFPLAKMGKGFQAIIGATLASTAGGLIGVAALMFLAPLLAKVTLKFGPPEYFWVSIFGLTIIASLGEKNILKTLISGALGLLLGTIGITSMGGDLRFGFGLYQLQAGVELTVALIGMFCIPEALAMIGSEENLYEKHDTKSSHAISEIKETWRLFWKARLVVLQSGIIGTIIGILPGAGGSIANLVAYNEAKRISPNRDKFGTGEMDGLIASETANNATVGAGLIPTLTLGIPGTPVAAIIYGAMMMHGLQPGLSLFEKSGDTVYAMMWALVIATLMMSFVGSTMGSNLYKVVSKVPRKFMAPTILLLSAIGSYAVRNSMLDVYLMFVFGVIAYFLRKLSITPGALVLGLILGTIVEDNFVRSVMLSRASSVFSVFFARPISLLLIVLSAISFAWPLYKGLKARMSHKKQA